MAMVFTSQASSLPSGFGSAARLPEMGPKDVVPGS